MWVLLLLLEMALAMSAFADPTIPLRRSLAPSADKVSEIFFS
jgi:hypothetical protein